MKLTNIFRFKNISFFFLILMSLRVTAQDSVIELPLVLTIDEIYSYEISCRLNSQTSDLQGIHRHEFREILSEWVDSEHMALWDELPMEDYMTPGMIESIGMGLHYNPTALAIQLTIPQSYRLPRVISLSGTSSSQSANLNDAVQPENFSAYLNLWGNHQWESPETTNPNGLNHKLTLEQVTHLYDWNLRTKNSWKNTSQWEDPQITLGRDLQRIHSRLELGHYSIDSQGFQQAGQYQGMAVTYLTDTDLGGNEQSNLSKTFILEESALVEVWVNHRKVKEMELFAGKYDLRDFSFYSGINMISLIIQYDNGRIETLQYNQPYQSQLLTQGAQKFHYSLGMTPWELDTERTPWSQERQIFSAYHDIGLRDTFNLGVNYQIEDRTNLSGLQLKWASPAGIVSLDGALQWEEWEYQAWGTQGSYQLILNSHPWIPRLGWNLRYQSPDFQSSAIQWESSFNLSQKLFGRSSASAGLNYRHYTDSRENKWMLNGRYNLPLDQRITCSLFCKINPMDPWTEESQIQFNIQFQNNNKRSVTNLSQDLVTGGTKADWQKSLPSQGLNLSSGVSLPGNDDSEGRSIQSGLSFQNHRMNSYGNLSALGGMDDPVQYSGSLQYGTAMVFAGHFLSVSAPVYDSFAMVIPRYQLENRRIGVNPDPRYEAKSGWLGPAVISSLSAYRSREISLELLDFQEEDFMLMNKSRILLYPEWRSGLLIFVGNPPLVALKWKLIDALGEPIPYISGKIQDKQGESWFFTDEAGTAYAYGLQEGLVNIEVPGYAPLEIQIQKPEGDIFDAGKLTLNR